MAKKAEVVITCDFDEDLAVAKNMHFIWDGDLYEIDLCQFHLDHYLTVLAEFKQHGRRIGKAKSPASKPVSNRTAARRAHDARIREWAKDHGYPVMDQGRIPATVKEAYANRPRTRPTTR